MQETLLTAIYQKSWQEQLAYFIKFDIMLHQRLFLLYHATSFAPFLAYDSSVWGLTYPLLLNPVSVLQKKILRVITFSDKNAPSAPIFNNFQSYQVYK